MSSTESQWLKVEFAVGDDKRSGAGIEASEPIDQLRFGGRIERGSRFVENEQAGAPEQAPGENQALPLAAGKAAAAIAERLVKPGRESADALAEPDDFERAPQLDMVGAGTFAEQIAAYGVTEHHAVLPDVGDRGAPRRRANLAPIGRSSIVSAPRLGLEQARNEVERASSCRHPRLPRPIQSPRFS